MSYSMSLLFATLTVLAVHLTAWYFQWKGSHRSFKRWLNAKRWWNYLLIAVVYSLAWVPALNTLIAMMGIATTLVGALILLVISAFF